MTTVPTKTEDWITNRWKRDGVHGFWHHQNRMSLMPRTLYEPYRDSHEIAHLIMCEDAAVDDPLWGLPDFTSSSLRGRLPARAFVIETQVEQIAKLIELHLWRHRQIHDYRIKPAATPWSVGSTLYRYGDLDLKTTVAICETTIEEWPIERIWNELSRKYALWDAKPPQPRDHLGRWTIRTTVV